MNALHNPTMLRLAALALSLFVSACATPMGDKAAPPSDKAALPYSSPECLAKKLKPVDPFPAADIPEAALAKRQGGWVAIRYDVSVGVAQNLTVVGSNPAGLYDAAALRHLAKYRDATKATVSACVTMIDVKF